MSKTKAHFSKFILPVSFNEKTVEEIKFKVSSLVIPQGSGKNPKGSNKVWELIDDKEINEFFLPHFAEFLMSSTKQQYLKRYRLTKPALSFFFSLNGKDKLMEAELNDYKASFCINDVELYIFQSGIAIIIIETTVHSISDINEIILFNYYMKYISKYSASIKFQIKSFHPEKINELKKKKKSIDRSLNSTHIPGVFKDLHHYNIIDDKFSISRSIRFKDLLFGCLDLAFPSDNEYQLITGERLLCFSYIFTNELTEMDTKLYLYQSSRLVKETYKATKADLDDEQNKIRRTYKNIYFGASLEGASVIVTDDNNPYFETFQRNVKHGYFIIYLTSLHNRLALLHFRYQIASILPTIIPTDRFNKMLIRNLRDLRNKAISCYINSNFSQITNNTSYEQIYQYYNNVFYLSDLNQEIQSKTTELEHILKDNIDRQSNNMMNALTKIGYILAPLTIATGFLGMNIGTFNENGAYSNPLLFSWDWFYFLAGGLLISSVLGLILIHFRNKND